jgi:hypothetical protein
MKYLKRLSVFAFILFMSVGGYGQKVSLLEGDLSPLKSEKSIDFAFTYDSITMGGKNHPSEAEYVAKKTADYNKKEPGKGDAWAKAWKEDRETRYQPAFTKTFEEYSTLKMAAGAKYTVIFKTTFIEPGFNMMVHQEPARISGVAWIVETSNKSHVIAKINVEKAPGRGYFGSEFDTGERITEAYESAARGLGYFVRGKM